MRCRLRRRENVVIRAFGLGKFRSAVLKSDCSEYFLWLPYFTSETLVEPAGTDASLSNSQCLGGCCGRNLGSAAEGLHLMSELPVEPKDPS